MGRRDDTPRNQHIAHRLLRARDWQDRPQFGLLCDWWRDGYGGVCALVGIGGAGKTAIADRFVRSLPGVLPTPDVDVDATLTSPRGLFVFSFYDAPNPDAFFRELAAWLDDRDDAEASYEPPGGVFILPVRLSECDVPSFMIDSTTTLEDLQLVDLFPEAQRPDALRRLVAALQTLPDHPARKRRAGADDYESSQR